MSAPRVERARLVWVCVRCADRTDVACARCGTPLTEPRRSGEGFSAWCGSCGVAIQLDATATEQRHLETAPPPAARAREAPPEVEAPAVVPVSRAPGEVAPSARSHALEITTEASSGADFRSADRRVSIVCRPREAVRDDRARDRLWLAAVLLAASALLLWLGARTGSVGLISGGVAGGLLFAVIFAFLLRRRPEPPPAVTRVRVGPSGLEVARDGAPAWRVETSRVRRVFAATDEGVIRVRVQLEDDTQRELVAGLTDEEASELVAQVDRAIPGRQAG